VLLSILYWKRASPFLTVDTGLVPTILFNSVLVCSGSDTVRGLSMFDSLKVRKSGFVSLDQEPAPTDWSTVSLVRAISHRLIFRYYSKEYIGEINAYQVT
jgi:hypothetical protein